MLFKVALLLSLSSYFLFTVEGNFIFDLIRGQSKRSNSTISLDSINVHSTNKGQTPLNWKYSSPYSNYSTSANPNRRTGKSSRRRDKSPNNIAVLKNAVSQSRQFFSGPSGTGTGTGSGPGFGGFNNGGFNNGNLDQYTLIGAISFASVLGALIIYLARRNRTGRRRRRSVHTGGYFDDDDEEIPGGMSMTDILHSIQNYVELPWWSGKSMEDKNSSTQDDDSSAGLFRLL